MIEGLFIVIEGIDGAGTTTQARLLHEALRARGLPVHTTREPSDGPVGMLLRQFLTNRVVVPGMHGSHPPSWRTMALLFAADRQDHLEAEVLPNLMEGVSVISDRYDYSSVAYQSAGNDEPEVAEWVQKLNQFARRPDLAIVIDVDPEVASNRRRERSSVVDLYEEDELQAKLAEVYRNLPGLFPNDRIVIVDGNGPQEAVAAAVMREVRILRNEPVD